MTNLLKLLTLLCQFPAVVVEVRENLFVLLLQLHQLGLVTAALLA